MKYKPSILLEQKNIIEYFILQGNSFAYQLNKSNFVALHYALKNNFIVSPSSPKQDITILEDSLFLANKANSYMLKNNEVSNSSVITILIDNQYFANVFNTNLNIYKDFKSFITNPNLAFAILKCNNHSRVKDKFLDDVNISLLNNGNISSNQLIHLVKKILINIDGYYDFESISSTPLIEDILEYIRTNSTTVNLKILSQRYNYSVSYISELIHKETGLTFSQTLKSIRMANSLKLLKTTDKTVNEISESVGYNSTTGFILAFQDTYNMTPTEYRRNNTNLN